jgi:hypothetical protein
MDKVTVEYADGRRHEIEFAELQEFSVNHDIREKERIDGYLDHECQSTTITLKGKLAGSPKPHEHNWKNDSFGAVLDSNPPHYGLVCDCGARACGNLRVGEVHNVKEFGG